ncbi:hypothetical protein GGX14DRAFT_432273 [Mycena pura]|uniref:F-box domain-containing protein n=1 Tax=Mycena pura TaxID=153505 RepID=A0AAD6VSZ4_9AGAR|nr:hypothetical protein GGX14DRAFT_432273 [Mycena pura]
MSILPDEMISEILSPALTIDDDAFSDMSPTSPFSSYAPSTSAYLLVCKSWLRVATPLLYNVVILRSKAQAVALARTLSEKRQKNDFGKLIKKLRVEGGYGDSMYTILQRTPKISDLFLSFKIFGRDGTAGLCKGLHLINPARLILQDSVFGCSPSYDEDGPSVRDFILPLVRAKQLHTVLVPGPGAARWAYKTFKGCPLQNIHIQQPLWHADLALISDPALEPLLRYITKESGALSGVIAPSMNPLSVPMSAMSQQVQDRVWSRVLYFAMSVPERARDPMCEDLPRRLPLLLVSKIFHRLGLPYHYVHILLTEPQVFPNFASVQSHRLLIQTISSPCSSSISWTDFEKMAKLSGASLRECCIQVEQGNRLSPAVFSDLAALQKLEWNCKTSFVCTSMRTLVDALSGLEDLKIRELHETFLVMLSLMKLKSLRRFAFSCSLKCEPFLRVHGTKLREIEIPLALRPVESLSATVFELCPNLCSASFSWTYGFSKCKRAPNKKVFLPGQPASSLTELKFLISHHMDISLNEYGTNNAKMRNDWKDFFDTFSYQDFPSLREIQVTSFGWPTNQRDIIRCFWVPIAEALLVRNINLTDSKGKKWRPRLMVNERGLKKRL